jgi:hypothetical protein
MVAMRVSGTTVNSPHESKDVLAQGPEYGPISPWYPAYQLRREFEQRERELRCQLFNRVREIEQLNSQKKELQGVVERVHDVVHPDRSEAVVLSERPSVTTTSEVTH